MTVVTLTMRQYDKWPQVNTAIVHDIIWALAAPDVALEHAHVVKFGRELRIALFFNARTPIEARSAGLRLCALACNFSPALQDWEVSG